MKVLQLGKFYPIRGGVEKVMYDLTLGLSEQGISCDMLCAATENHPAETIALNACGRILVMPTQLKLAATMIAPLMITTLRKIANTYDIIHIHHPDPMACLALWLSGYKGKVVLHWHADILKQRMLLKLYKPLQNWLIKRADIIVGTSPVYVAESTFLQHVQHKLDYIPIGVEPAQVDRDQVRAIRARYAGKRLVFSLGRLVEYKGYEYLIRAAANLPDNYQILIGGKGPLHDTLKHLIADLGLKERVCLLGFLSDKEVPNYFAAADVFCLSSIWKTEAFAIVQIEAMSVGVPVVSTYIPGSGVSWVNKEDVSGLIVEAQNEEMLANALRRIFDEEGLRQRLSTGSTQRYQNYFTREAMVAKSRSIYTALLRQ
ncbi:glycosyltransferase [Sphingobacterium suaedae]|uniref:Glycosyltransferase n=1 Tax=Sphingobacterium suaedae TaxID=1686402 RepID=A0ABW5KNM6_9SPHI